MGTKDTTSDKPLPSEWGNDTLAVRSGIRRTAENEHSEPVFMTSSFVFDSAAQAQARFCGDAPGNVYSRFTNPTVRAFEQRLADMEGGERCIATSSGMAAIQLTCLGLLRSGDHIVASQSLFGTTIQLFQTVLTRFNIETSFVPLTDYQAWEQAIQKNTRLLFMETPSNPTTEIADIERLAQLAHRYNSLLVVDNCFCTPALQRPFRYGADLVIHSATKYLDGQGRCVGGAVIGDAELVEKELFPILRVTGPSMSPFNAWVIFKGLETLSLRMRAHSEGALRLAQWLREQPQVSHVYYPGLEDHPQHALAMRQQETGGGVVSFNIKGGREQAWKLIDATRIFSITANLGDCKSTITHPATTTHWRLSEEEKARSGISENLVRLSVGLECVDDLIADLQRGL